MFPNDFMRQDCISQQSRQPAPAPSSPLCHHQEYNRTLPLLEFLCTTNFHMYNSNAFNNSILTKSQCEFSWLKFTKEPQCSSVSLNRTFTTNCINYFSLCLMEGSACSSYHILKQRQKNLRPPSFTQGSRKKSSFFQLPGH